MKRDANGGGEESWRTWEGFPFTHARPLNFKAYSLNSEFILPNWHTVHKLYGTPQSVELCALIYVHDAIFRCCPLPDRVINVRLDASEHNLKHGEAATQALPGEQVTFTGNVRLLSMQIKKTSRDNLVRSWQWAPTPDKCCHSKHGLQALFKFIARGGGGGSRESLQCL